MELSYRELGTKKDALNSNLQIYVSSLPLCIYIQTNIGGSLFSMGYEKAWKDKVKVWVLNLQ